MFWNCVVSAAVSVFVTVCAPWAVTTAMVQSTVHDSLAVMLINKAFTGIPPAVNMLWSTLTLEGSRVDVLSFGATPYEAAWPAYTATFRQVMIPVINERDWACFHSWDDDGSDP